MSKYTTGELAKLCGVTVRTVQYYDTRGILVPTELTEGGRRLYSEDDVKRMKIICFLRDLGLPIDSIAQLLKEEDPAEIIDLLIKQQEIKLKQEVEESQGKLDRLTKLRRELKDVEHFTVESIGDVAYAMENKKKLNKVHRNMLLVGLPVSVLQWGSLVLGVLEHIWWPFIAYLILVIPYGIWVSRYYMKKVSYICPACHTVFKPGAREMMFARHTPSTRKLTCTCCGHNGFCVEVATEEDAE